MSTELIETLPLVQRLALSYAPKGCREDTLALLAMDTRLAGIVRSDGEPVIAQMKLAWWRERIAQDPQNWPLGEPLLAQLRDGKLQTTGLGPLVDGWESLLANVLDTDVIDSFASGRAALWNTLALAYAKDGRGATQAAREYAMVDLANNLGTEEDAALARDVAGQQPWGRASLRRALRPLAILHSLSRRSLNMGAPELLNGAGAMATVLRVGFLGR